MLSMKMDAYVCCGRAKSGDNHVWVMSRDYDGAVVFWECTNGQAYVVRAPSLVQKRSE